jgi:hypothetical protein
MTNKLILHIAGTVGIAIFSMTLPLLFTATLWSQKLGLRPDEIWFVKVMGTVLFPFGAVLWLITISNLVFRRRAGFVRQALVFFGTAVLIYLLLSSGVYTIYP